MVVEADLTIPPGREGVLGFGKRVTSFRNEWLSHQLREGIGRGRESIDTAALGFCSPSAEAEEKSELHDSDARKGRGRVKTEQCEIVVREAHAISAAIPASSSSSSASGEIPEVEATFCKDVDEETELRIPCIVPGRSGDEMAEVVSSLKGSIDDDVENGLQPVTFRAEEEVWKRLPG